MPESTLSNVLSESASPYLLQHKDNPVHWQVWGDRALIDAKRSGKPILLSIGYAACHWCHVMAHESFEDPATAEVMNNLFVNIKVDREERSDIDQIYMAALHAQGEQGGWPLTMFLTSDAEPFWGGTYFPKTPTYGRPGFVTVLETIAKLYHAEPDKIARNVSAIRSHLDRTLSAAGVAVGPEPDLLARQTRGILSIIDRRHGGIGTAPKFPNASMLETLWRSWHTSGSDQARDAALAWLRAMTQGGIYDHLGGGLARYSVDARWLVPHFEKMLYDNAQLIRSLAWAHSETGDALFRIRINETVDWLRREMRLPGGAFASSLDADSEGEEGRFYIWQQNEIDTLLGPDADLFNQTYDVTGNGNWEGKTILNRLADPYLNDAGTEARLADARAILLAARVKRVRPGLDDKVLADWNGLLIRALAEAGHILDEPAWLTLATDAYDFIVNSMRHGDRLAHAWRDGTTTYPALASDYGAMINAALSLYQAKADGRYLDQARRFATVLERHYSDDGDAYYYTADDCTDVLLRTRHEHDDAVPSASAQILEALARLALIDNDPDRTQHTHRMAAALWGRVRDMPMAASGAVNAIATAMNPKKLVLLNPAQEFLAVTRATVDPARIDLVVSDPAEAVALVPGNVDTAIASATAYLCNGPVCLPPIRDPDTLREALRSNAG